VCPESSYLKVIAATNVILMPLTSTVVGPNHALFRYHIKIVNMSPNSDLETELNGTLEKECYLAAYYLYTCKCVDVVPYEHLEL